MLHGKKIKLRALEPDDIDALYQWENDVSIWKVSGTLLPFSKHFLKKYIADSHHDIYLDKQLRLVIDLTTPLSFGEGQGVRSIGCVDLFDFDAKNKRAGIGILIGEKNARLNGYASEALKILINYAFNILALHQLYCNITADNKQSLNLFKKHKFKIIGLKKDWIFAEGKWLNEYTLQRINKIGKN